MKPLLLDKQIFFDCSNKANLQSGVWKIFCFLNYWLKKLQMKNFEGMTKRKKDLSSSSLFVFCFVLGFSGLEIIPVAYYANVLCLANLSIFLIDMKAPKICDLVDQKLHEHCLEATGSVENGLLWAFLSAAFWILSYLVYPIQNCFLKNRQENRFRSSTNSFIQPFTNENTGTHNYN
jgi:hypothetical protein